MTTEDGSMTTSELRQKHWREMESQKEKRRLLTFNGYSIGKLGCLEEEEDCTLIPTLEAKVY